MQMTAPFTSPDVDGSSQVELAQRFLERYSIFLKDLALSDKFEVLKEMPEFQSFVSDTRAIFNAQGE